jgi:epoxyqueuosine reductase
MDAEQCISYLTIENRGPIPEPLRAPMGNRIYGCDICQEVCPFNQRFARDATEASYAARGPAEPAGPGAPPGVGHPGTDGPPLVELMAMDAPTWDEFTRGSPIRRAGYDGFRRNVAVALGNWGDPSAREVLTAALASESAIVREHAAWALDRIGGHQSIT